MLIEKLQPRSWDERRDIIVPGDNPMTLIYCVEHFIAASKRAIKDHDAFSSPSLAAQLPKPSSSASPPLLTIK